MGYGDGESENHWGLNECGPSTRFGLELIRSLFAAVPVRKARRRKPPAQDATHKKAVPPPLSATNPFLDL